MEKRNVVLHSLGPNWEIGVDPREQPGIDKHIEHYQKFFEQEKLFYGGPFLDLDSGGMMIADLSVSREELEQFAASDPAVRDGLLTFEIKTWFVAMKK